MDVTLIHNPKAGSGTLEEKELIEEFRRAGHEVVYNSAKDKKLTRAFHDPGEVVVIAGGDGTVRKVARHVIGSNVPIAVLPLGTANNIAKALGLDRTPRQLIRDLASSHPIRFDVGMVRGPWGDVLFFEGAGIGVFPRMMADIKKERKRGTPVAVDAEGGVDGGVRFLRRVLDTFRGRQCTVKLDGREQAGSYLLIEAMNIPSIGPAVELAPEAQLNDGLLDVVLIQESHRQDLREYLDGRPAKSDASPFTVRRVRQVQLTCAAADVHFDDELWPRPNKKDGTRDPIHTDINIEMDIFPGALRVLVP